MTQAKFKQKKKLSRIFMLFFALAVSFPLIGLIRLGVDSYFQSIQLKKREVFNNYEQKGKTLDKLYVDYRKSIYNLGVSFYDAPILKKLPGAKKPKLWLDIKDHFFKRIKKDKENKLRLVYSKHFKELQKKVYGVFSKSDDIIDSSDCPLSIQVVVLERSFFSNRYKKAPLETKKLTYYELFKGHRPIIYDTKKDRENGWEKLGVLDYLNRFPCQLIFPATSEKDKLVWDGVYDIFRTMYRASVVGPNSSNEERVAIKNILQSSIEGTRGNFTNIKVFGQSLSFYWQLYPKNYSFEKFSSLKNHKIMEVPLGSFAIIVDDYKLEKGYFSLLNKEVQVKGLTYWLLELIKIKMMSKPSVEGLSFSSQKSIEKIYKEYFLFYFKLNKNKKKFLFLKENWHKNEINLPKLSKDLSLILPSSKAKLKKRLSKINKLINKHRKVLIKQKIGVKLKHFLLSYKSMIVGFLKCHELKFSLKRKGDRSFFLWQAKFEKWKSLQKKLFESFEKSDIDIEIFRKRHLKKKQKTYFISSKGRKTNLKHDDKIIKLESIIGVLNPKTGEFVLKSDSMNDYLSSTQNKINDSSIYDLIELVKQTGKSSHFTYLKGKDRWLGTLYPSKVIAERIYFFTQSENFLIKEILSITYIVFGIIVLALLSTLILGALMSKRIITPVSELTKKISRLADGKYDEKVEITENNELGKLAHHFNEMADNIQEKLFYMKAVDDINRLMNNNHSRMIMLKYILHLLSVKYRAGLGLIGFFHKALSVRPHEYSIYESALVSQKEQEDLVEKVLLFVSDNTEAFKKKKTIILDKKQLEFFHPKLKNGLIYYLSDDLNSDSVSISGVLFLSDISDLANVEDNLKQIILVKDVDIVIKMIESLCEQAKTIVMKSLLDEIGGDTEKGWEVQKSLMPNYDPDGLSCLDIASYFEGAIGLAGDYFDYLEFEDKTLLGFSIADVSGKGIGPSLFGATSRAFMKVLSQKYLTNTAQALIDLNDNISYDKTSSLFLTMFYCVIDLKTLKMFYSSAGHNKMFLLKKSGKLVYLSAKGLVIGMFSPVIYEQKSIDIEIGDELILYTDGVTEHENPNLDLYGDDKFEDFCKKHQGKPSKEWVQTLSKDLEDFRAGIFPSDDITYIRVRILKQLEVEIA